MTMICQEVDDALSARAMAEPIVPDAPVRRQTFLAVQFSCRHVELDHGRCE